MFTDTTNNVTNQEVSNWLASELENIDTLTLLTGLINNTYDLNAIRAMVKEVK